MLQDKTIVVTGGAGLIGTAYCKAIASAGGRPVVADIDASAAETLAEEIGPSAAALSLDIADVRSVQAMIRSLTDRFGGIDGIVNNAYPRNKNYGRHVEDVDYLDFCENLSLHLGGYFLVMQQMAICFAAQPRGGSIVNMASIYGVTAPRFEIYDGTPMTTPVEYAAIKSAVLHLTRYFAQYYRKAGVRVNAISPGGIEDNQPESFLAAYKIQCGQTGMLAADDLTASLVFLLSDGARHITGQNLVVDDGFTL